MRIEDLAKKNLETVEIKGWVTNKRESKGLIFLNLRDGSGIVQCIVSMDTIGTSLFDKISSLGLESSLEISGDLVQDDRQIGGVEIHVSTVKIIQSVNDYPIANKEHGADFLLDKRHLWLRSRRQWAIMRVRNTIVYSVHQFFQKEGFVQMDAPILTANACEGTSDLFTVDYFDQDAYLSQSGQLYGEAMAMALGKIYTFGPTFRSEKSKTRRHLAEFWMIEPEMIFCDIFQNMDVIEKFIQFVVAEVLKKNKKELDVLERDTQSLEKVKNPFKRLSYDQAIEILKGKENVNGKSTLEVLEEEMKKLKEEKIQLEKNNLERLDIIRKGGIKKGKIAFHQSTLDKQKQRIRQIEEDLRNLPQWLDSAANFQYGNDLGGSDETVLTKMFDVPVMVYDWPHEIKAFYMKRNPNNPKFARGVDLLAPEGYGEIVGGGERETDLNWLKEKIIEHNLPMSEFEWYLDLRRYGTVPHSGFGLGLERLVSWICKLNHVREAIPFPRMFGRIEP